MTDRILQETIINIHEAATLFPGRDGKKKLNFSTVWRWVLKGLRTNDGRLIRLEAVRLGGRWVTSREAIARFTEALTPKPDDDPPGPAPRTPAQRKRDLRTADEKLAAIGVK
jgi:hypothetical protein